MQFRVLGPVEVLDRGEPLDIGTPRQRALLARLLVDANKVVPLDRIIDDLWEGEPPAAATATLQSYVSLLRRVLEPDRPPRTPATVLVTRPPGYLLAVADADLDAAVFAAAVERGRALLAAGRPAEAEAAFDDALALWRGEPYADVELDAFVQVERQRLVERRASALEDRFTALLDQGRHRYALGDLEAFVAEHPYRERGWELLVLARYRAGRQVDALRAYQQARDVLVDHVGVEPGAGLVELERRVVAQDPTLEWHPAEAEPVPEPASAPAPAPGRGHADGTGALTATGRPAELVGRAAEVATLERAIGRLRAGTGGLLVVSGDAGIGKTHLVEVVTGAAAGSGARVGWGRSGDDDGAPSFWPWNQALAALAADAPDEVLARAGAVVGHVVPALADRLGPAPALPDDPSAARFALHRAVGHLLEGLAAEPTVVVLDDAHWADVSSLQLLAALSSRLVELPLLVVLTVRPAEARESAALVDALGLAARELEVGRVELGGLDRDGVAAYLAEAGVDASPRVVEVLHGRSGGNPFFLGELARLLSSQGPGGDVGEDAAREVPHGVRDVVQQRLARLPDPSRELLGTAAVAGRVVDLLVLANAADLEPEAALDRLEPAVVSGMVVLDEADALSLSFSHDLVRDAVYAELSAVRRTRLHRRLAEALIERFGDGPGAPAAQVAFHYSGSLALGTGEAALTWARRAAEAATARAADAEAAHLWELASRALAAVRPDDTATRLDLLVERSSSLRRAWDLDAAREAVDEALEVAVELDDPLRLAEAAALYGGVNLWTWRQVGTVGERTVALLEDAIPRLPPDAHVTRSRAAGALAVELYYGPDVERCLRAADESVREAEASGQPAELARALNNAFITRWRPGREPELLALVDRMLSLPGPTPQVEAIGLMHRMMLLLTFDRLDEAAALVPRLGELRAVVREPDVAAQLDFVLATWAGLHGDRATAEDLVERGWTVRYADSTMWGGEWVYLVGRLTLGAVGDLDAVADRLVELSAGEVADLVRPTAAVALVEAGRLDEARAVLGAGPLLGDCWADTFNAVQWGLVHAELGLPTAPWRARLEPMADRLVVAGSCLAVWGSMHWVLARLAEAEGDAAAAERHWAAADEVDGRLGLGPAPRRGEGVVRRYPGTR